MKESYTFFILSILLSLSLCSWSYDDDTNTTLLSDISGNVWIETDGNSMFDGELGPSGVLILLLDSDEDTIVAQSTTVSGKYEFNNVNPGKYYLRLDASAFGIGAPLFGLQSCFGFNDANDMVDDDDNGSDTGIGVQTTSFTLTDDNPSSNTPIEYIDFCFSNLCEEPSPFAVNACDQIDVSDIFCDINALDNFCAVLPSIASNGIQPEPLCDGFNTAENISWFAFVASEGNYSINFTPLECTMVPFGQPGMQVGIYEDCSFTESVFCSDCSTNTISVGSSLLNPGQVYYVYINGCSGNVCNYRMMINGNATEPSLEPSDICIFFDDDFVCQDVSYCPDADIRFRGRDLPELGDFVWSVTDVSGTPYEGDSLIMTNENELILNFPAEGTYSICLAEVTNGCQSWTGEVCSQVTTTFSIPMPADEDFGEFFVCENELDEFTINVFAADDPNGDGDFGWNAPFIGVEFMLGLNEAVAYTEGCSYEQQFTLSTYPSNPVPDVLVSICEEDLPAEVAGLNFSIFTFGGERSLTFDSLLLMNTTDQNGCDSIINLTVERLNILQGRLLDPVCVPEGFLLEFDFISDLSTDEAFLTYNWFDPAGNPLPNGAEPNTTIAPFESGSGEYALEVVIDKNSTTCTYAYSVFIDILSFLPPAPVVEGDNLVCEGASPVVYVATGNGAETNFIWSFPNDIALAALSGNFNDTLTVDWTGSAGGSLSVVGQSDCGQSNPTSYPVEIIEKTTPDFRMDTSVCVDNVTVIDFFGTGINISDYTWDFDGGMIISGSGMGPYELNWNTAGDKTVSLFTTDTNGCPSNTVEKNISVKSPLSPTEVMCSSTVDEIIFTWEIPLNVNGFQVNVLSGQTGGVFGPNSFSISGLDENEEVTIELLTIPDDPICGEFVTTIISCSSQSCTPPEIELSAISALCVTDNSITIQADIVSGEPGTGIFTGPGITDAINGIFDPTIANIGNNTIFYTYTSDAGACQATASITISVFDQPVAAFVQDLDTMCILDTLNLNYSGTPNVSTLTWNLSDGQGSGLLTNQNVIFPSSGLKTISLQVEKDGCISEPVSSAVLVEPAIGDLVVQCDTAGTDFITFSWNDLDNIGVYLINVDDDPQFFTMDTSVTIEGLNEEQEVNILVTAVSSNACPGNGAASMCTTMKTISVSVSDDQDLSDWKIYPNPARDLLYIDHAPELRWSYQVFSILGERISVARTTSNALDLTPLPSGIYLLRIVDQESRLYKDFKVIKE